MNNQNFQKVITELESLDKLFREQGIPEEYKKKWGVNVNVGLWNVGRKTAEFLHDLVLEHKPGNILELGTSLGYSALWLGKAASNYGGKVHTVEKEAYKVTEAREYIKRAELELSITCINSRILEYSEEIDYNPNLLFIDAGKREYLDYLKAFEEKLAPKAIIVADNINDFPEQTKAFIDYLEAHSGWKTTINSLEHGISITQT